MNRRAKQQQQQQRGMVAARAVLVAVTLVVLLAAAAVAADQPGKGGGKVESRSATAKQLKQTLQPQKAPQKAPQTPRQTQQTKQTQVPKTPPTPQQTASQQTASQQTASQQTASQQTASQQTASQQTASQQTASQQTTPQQTVPQQATPQPQTQGTTTPTTPTTPQQPVEETMDPSVPLPTPRPMTDEEAVDELKASLKDARGHTTDKDKRLDGARQAQEKLAWNAEAFLGGSSVANTAFVELEAAVSPSNAEQDAAYTALHADDRAHVYPLLFLGEQGRVNALARGNAANYDQARAYASVRALGGMAALMGLWHLGDTFARHFGAEGFERWWAHGTPREHNLHYHSWHNHLNGNDNLCQMFLPGGGPHALAAAGATNLLYLHGYGDGVFYEVDNQRRVLRAYTQPGGAGITPGVAAGPAYTDRLKYLVRARGVGKHNGVVGGGAHMSDRAGHIIGRQFGGTKCPLNFFPQAIASNEHAESRWKVAEADAARLLGHGCTVDLDIRFNYANAAFPMRPSDGTYTVTPRAGCAHASNGPFAFRNDVAVAQ